MSHWTKTRPTTEGWYQWRPEPGRDWTPYFLRLQNNAWFVHDGAEPSMPIEEFDDGEWSSEPIASPDEPVLGSSDDQ